MSSKPFKVIDKRHREEVRGLGGKLVLLGFQAQRPWASRSTYRQERMDLISSIVDVADSNLHDALHPYDDPVLMESHGEQLLDFVIRLSSEWQWNTWRELSMKASISVGATDVLLRLLASYEDTVDEGTLSKLLNLAATKGNIEVLPALIAAGAGPLVRASDDVGSLFNALHCAAGKGHRRFVASLIEAGAYVDRRLGAEGRTALAEAVLRQHEGVAVDLLAAGADVDTTIYTGIGGCRPKYDFTPLWIAFDRKNKRMVKILLEAGAVPSNCPAHDRLLDRATGRTAYKLFYSLMSKPFKVIDRRHREEVRGLGEELVLLGFQTQRAVSSRSIYRQERMDLISIIVADADRELHDTLHPYDDPVLMESHGEQLLDFVIRLSSEWQWNTWRELSMKASIATDVFLRLLASYKDPVDERTLSELLNLAATEGNVEILSALIAAGAGPLVRASNKVGSPLYALHIAARNGHRRFVASLIEAGAHVDRRHGAEGRTALLEAVLRRHRGIAVDLLAAGADVNTVYPRLGQFLVNFTSLCAAVDRTDEKMVKVLLEAGAAPSTGPTHGQPLHMAARQGSHKIFNGLILAGASLSSVDPLGRSALHLACGYSQHYAVDILLRHNASGSLLCNDGLSPMDVVGTAILARRQGCSVRKRLTSGVVVSAPSTLNSAETSTVDKICDLLQRYVLWGRRGWLVLMRSRPLVEVVEHPHRSDEDRLTLSSLDISLVKEPSSMTAETRGEGDTARAFHDGGHVGTAWSAAVVWMLQVSDEMIFRSVIRYL